MHDQLKKTAMIVPVTFDGHAGTLHFPPAGHGVRAVAVIVPPLGRDRIWTYRALFEWANMLARRGYAVLRYDPRDEGDSLFFGAGEEALASWLKGVEEASRFARRIFENRPLALVGLRIGATFAWQQVETVKPSALVLWDPLPSWQHWVRELNLASVMVRVAHTLKDGIEVNGLHLTARTLAQLEHLVLPKGTEDWPSVLLSSPSAAKVVKPRLGNRVDQIAFGGYTDLFKDSHVNKIPARLFEDTLAWLDEKFPVQDPLSTPLSLPSAILSSSTWREERVEFGKGLMGILCLPIGPLPRRSVVFCNTSANPRAGDGNFTTRACRELAQSNIATLRFDFSGYGESPAEQGEGLHVYETSRTEELKAATRMLKQRGISSVSVAGVCTGGYHAFRALLESDEIDQAVPINAWLHWKAGTALDRAEHVEAARAVYLKVPAEVRKYLRFRHKLRSLVMPKLALLKRSLVPNKTVMVMRSDVQKALRRDGKLDIIMWNEDRALEGLEDFGRKGSWFSSQAGASLSLLPDIDHGLEVRHSQTMVISELRRIMSVDQTASRK